MPVRTVTLLLAISTALADSHPSWWTYASPDATSLVGIRWETLRLSPFAEAIAAELGPGGSLRFPDLPCLRDAREVIVSSPALLAMVAGEFPAAVLRDQAKRAGMTAVTYHGVPMWIHPAKDTLSVAAIGDQLLLVATKRSLETTLDRTEPGTTEASRSVNRRYSPLLSRAAKFAQSGDLWVVATQLPDPLASLFVPLEVDAAGFDGFLSLRDGLHVEASIEAGSEAGGGIL